MNVSEVGKLMDTILSIPGMNDQVKIDLKISRRQVLLLTNVIERGIGRDGGIIGLLDGLPKDAVAEITGISDEFLTKAGLTELYEKLKLLGGKEKS